MFEDVVSLVLNNYVEEVKVDRVMEGAMRGLADGLDPDSAYLTAKRSVRSRPAKPLPDGDVGLELTRQFYLRVIAARDGSPAAKAGLQTGDYVRAIDGRPTRDMSVFEGSRLLHGQPGSKVMLTVIRGNAADPHELTLVREKAAGAVGLRASAGHRYRLRPHRRPSGRSRAADLKQAGRPTCRSQAPSRCIDRRAAHGGRPYRERHRGGAAVREVRNAGARGDGTRPKTATQIAAQAGDGAIDAAGRCCW